VIEGIIARGTEGARIDRRACLLLLLLPTWLGRHGRVISLACNTNLFKHPRGLALQARPCPLEKRHGCSRRIPFRRAVQTRPPSRTVRMESLVALVSSASSRRPRQPRFGPRWPSVISHFDRPSPTSPRCVTDDRHILAGDPPRSADPSTGLLLPAGTVSFCHGDWRLTPCSRSASTERRVTMRWRA